MLKPQPSTPAPTSRLALIIAVVVVLVLLIGGGVFFAVRSNPAPPRIVAIMPADGTTHVSPQQVIRITFDQEITPNSLASAISFDPPVDFTIAESPEGYLIQPNGELQYETTYHVRISTKVASSYGQRLAEPLEIGFTTSPFVTVREMEPPPDAEDVALHTPIRLVFDKPVVSEQTLASAAQDPTIAEQLPAPLRLDGPSGRVDGVGHWLSPDTYSFYPEGGLQTAADYTASVNTDVAAAGQVYIKQPGAWRFHTRKVLAVKPRPADGEKDVIPDRAIEVRFSPDVDVAAASTHFHLNEKQSGTPVAGKVQVVSDTSFRFVPDNSLKRDTEYQATLDGEVRSNSGVLLSSDPQTWAFTTMAPLEIVQVEPTPNTTEVLTATRRVSVHFNHPVVSLTTIERQADLPHPLTITPAVEGKGYWLDTSTYVFVPNKQLDAATTYEIVVDGNLQDMGGDSLESAYRWQFSTALPRVASTTPAGDEEQADPYAPVRIVFDQPMDAYSTLQAVDVVWETTGSSVDGAVEMEGDRVVVFTPSEPFYRGEYYRIEVSQDAQSSNKKGNLDSPFTTSFRTAPAPALVGSTPEYGATRINPSNALVLNFSTEMDWASVEQALTIYPPLPTYAYTSTSTTRFFVYNMLEPETDYTITIGASAQDIYGDTITSPQYVEFRTGSLPPGLSIIGTYKIGTYAANTPVRVPMQQVNVPTIQYRLYRLDNDKTSQLLNDYEEWREYVPPTSLLQKTDTITFDDFVPNRNQLHMLNAGKLKPGIYYLSIEGERQEDLQLDEDESEDRPLIERHIMVVTNYGLTMKRSKDSLFLWAVDMASGEPVADMPLNASYQPDISDYDPGANGEDTSTLYEQELGTTDSDGVLQVPFETSHMYNTIFVSSPDPDTFVYASSVWQDGISPWSYGVSVDTESYPIIGNVTTDRPIYRPNHTVHIRGAVRRLEHEQYTLLEPDENVWLEVLDPQDNSVFSAAVPLSEFGTFNTSIMLDSTASPGIYTISVLDEQKEIWQQISQGSFTVAEYRKPAFELELTPENSDIVQGEPLNIAIAAKYFSGGAVANAPIRWWLTADSYTLSSDAAVQYSFADTEDAYSWYIGDDWQQSKGIVTEGKTTTNDQGIGQISLPSDSVQKQVTETDGDGEEQHGSHLLTLSVEVQDVDGHVIASQTQVRLHAGAYAIGVRPDGYVSQAGQPKDVSLITVDTQGTPVGDKSLDVALYRREWYSVREEGVDGQRYWTSAYTDTLITTKQATTDERGRATLAFTPDEPGSYRIRASGRDNAGNEVVSSGFFWVYGGSKADVFWGINDSNHADLVADQTSYAPGDTARILVPAPYEGMQALMTIERGEVLEHRVLTLAGTSELIEVPITDDYAPNVYVSVVLIKPETVDSAADVRVGLINLPVSTEQQELTVAVAPNVEETGPREEVVYDIHTTDHTGAGVQAEVSLALVDKAVLMLKDDPNPTLHESFYQKRALGVLTAQSLTTLVNRVTASLDEEAKGGGGGASEGLIRRDFPDTAYWNPSVVTDQDGNAQVAVVLPDTLTTWRMTARGLTTDTKVGQGTGDIVTSKPLLVRPSLPRFLTIGDRPMLRFVVQNTTNEPLDTTVMLEVSGLNIATPVEQQVQVPANGQVVVSWQGEVVETDQQEATIWATVTSTTSSDDSLQDGVEQVIPLQRFVTPEMVATGGQVYDSPIVEAINFVVPSTRSANAEDVGEITLEMLPSLTAGIGSGLEYLESYPYACTEQTVSRFLPNAVMYQVYEELGLDEQPLKQGLEHHLTLALQRLYSLQQLDGGWGWWAADASHPYLTAYVVQGLLEAGKTGYGVDHQVLERALDYLEKTLADEDLHDRRNVRAYVLFVLAEAGRADRGRTIALYEERHDLSLASRAHLLMTLHTLGGEQSRVQTLTNNLTGNAILQTTSAHWEEDNPDYWLMDSTLRTTSLVVQALVRVVPDHFLVPNAVRYLMSMREDGHWRTTHETALALMALTAYMVESGEHDADYAYRIMLDQDIVAEGRVDATSSTATPLDEPIAMQFALADIVQDETAGEQTSSLYLEKNGTGRLYYTLHMRYYLDAQDVEPLDRGLGIQRVYSAVDPDTLQPTGQPVTSVDVGDRVQVQLTLRVPNESYYLTVEDMLPAGLEPLDTSLKTVSSLVEAPELQREGEEKPPWWYFTETELHDNRVAVFATRLSKGTYTYTYMARATTPGTYQTLPARVYQMYAPEVFGRSGGMVFAVEEP